MTIIEIAFAISVFTAIILAVGFTLLRGMQHQGQSVDYYRGMNALRDVFADIQNVANMETNLAAQEGVGAVYARYHNQTVTLAGLDSGQVTITCYPNEVSVPAILGGPQDLNFDGDADDNLANASNGTDLKLVPIRLVLSYGQENESQTLTTYGLITRTAD